jgi:hypothetical protein
LSKAPEGRTPFALDGRPLGRHRRRRSLGRRALAALIRRPLLTVGQVAQAHGMQRAGYRLGQIAGILGVLSSDLDRALWENIDTDVETLVAPRRPAPMF